MFHGLEGASRSAPALHRMDDVADDARVVIDFPPSPDDIRLYNQRMSHLSQAGWHSGLSGLSLVVLGLMGMGCSAYACMQTSLQGDEAVFADEHRWLGYAFGGSVALLSTWSITFGLSEICVCARKRREARQEMQAMSASVRFDARSGEANGRDFV